jgi:hypothetical protein
MERLKAGLEADVRQMQSDLDRTVLIHRVQFETEFSALREIWSKVAAARSTMGLVRPSATTSAPAALLWAAIFGQPERFTSTGP